MKLTLTLPPPDYARKSGEIIAAELAEVGVNAKIENVEWAQWLSGVYKDHNFDLTIISHVEPLDIGIYANPDYYFQYDSPAFRDIFAELEAAPDLDAFKTAIGEAQRKIADDCVNAFLFQLPNIVVADAKLQGLWKNAPIFVNDLSALSWRWARACKSPRLPLAPARRLTFAAERLCERWGDLPLRSMELMRPFRTERHRAARRLSRRRAVAARGDARAYCDRVARFEPHIHATYLLAPERALAEAKASEERWRRGAPIGPLDGVPATVKDNIATKGEPIPVGTAASDMTPAAADAPPAARLREAGAILFAKTTMPDYGMLSSGLSSFHQARRAIHGMSRAIPAARRPARRPRPRRVTARCIVGTDIGGSVRLPAGWCGLFGLKPSAGRVPIDPPYIGRVAGPLTRSVADAALMMATLSLPDARDYTSLPPQTPRLARQALLDWAACALACSWRRAAAIRRRRRSGAQSSARRATSPRPARSSSRSRRS